MCGIAGIVHEDPRRPVEPRALERMAAELLHRGPDDRGLWSAEGAGLAHARLAVIDLSDRGRQPLANEDGTVLVVFNGEIYNFRELRRELERRGHVFRSHTDTEVVVHLYEEDGADCVRQLDGMFAFAVWDVRRRRLLLARDRLGKKPLKYACVPGGLVFASELKAILACGLVDPTVDRADVGRYLALGFVPGPGTGIAGIRKLPPAHRLVWDGGRLGPERYWMPDFGRKRAKRPADWRVEVRESVRRAVAKRLVSDVPIGAFLSGGVDSSIVVACMSRALERPVETFSAGFEFDGASELPYARAVAERHHTSHHEFEVRADAAALLPRLARLLEEPFADCSALPCFLIAREARRHVTVALTGDGGDEGFAGYTRYARLAGWNAILDRAARLGVGRAAGRAAALAARLDPRLAARLDAVRHLADPELALRYGWMMRLFSEREQILLRGGSAPLPVGAAGESFAGWMARPEAGSAPLDRMSFADVMVYLPDDLLAKVDLTSMAHGLEARCPLLDPEVLAVAAAAPAGVRCPRGALKSLLRDAFRDELPEPVLRRGKAGFVVPLERWFRGPLLPLARDLLLAPDSRIRDWLDRPAVARLVDGHAARRADHGRQLWALVMLELWRREVVEGRSVPAPGRFEYAGSSGSDGVAREAPC